MLPSVWQHLWISISLPHRMQMRCTTGTFAQRNPLLLYLLFPLLFYTFCSSSSVAAKKMFTFLCPHSRVVKALHFFGMDEWGEGFYTHARRRIFLFRKGCPSYLSPPLFFSQSHNIYSTSFPLLKGDFKGYFFLYYIFFQIFLKPRRMKLRIKCF